MVVVVVKMKRQESAVGFAQNMDDGSGIRVRKSDRRPKDAERIDRDQGGGRPASKLIGQSGQHRLRATHLSGAFDIIFRPRGERKIEVHRPRTLTPDVRTSGQPGISERSGRAGTTSRRKARPLTSPAANGVYPAMSTVVRENRLWWRTF